jgi:hypothetical protein
MQIPAAEILDTLYITDRAAVQQQQSMLVFSQKKIFNISRDYM